MPIPCSGGRIEFYFFNVEKNNPLKGIRFMSLRIEQRLDNEFFTETGPRIYTTGAHIVPMKIKIGQNTRYVWVVDEFKDDSYDEGW